MGMTAMAAKATAVVGTAEVATVMAATVMVGVVRVMAATATVMAAKATAKVGATSSSRSISSNDCQCDSSMEAPRNQTHSSRQSRQQVCAQKRAASCSCNGAYQHTCVA